MDNKLLKEIAKRFFIGKPVKIGKNIEGQGLTESNAYRLGCYAGPEQNIEHLFHEMCHLAEREPKKLLEKPSYGWGFSHGKYWEVYGQSGFEPQTDQSVMREGRVWSYQLSVMREFQLPISSHELVSSAVYLSAFCYFKFKTVDKSLGYSEGEAKAIEKLAELVEDQSKVFTYDRFEENWNLRMDMLKSC